MARRKYTPGQIISKLREEDVFQAASLAHRMLMIAVASQAVGMPWCLQLSLLRGPTASTSPISKKSVFSLARRITPVAEVTQI
jgi:hypothetical protein